MTTLGGPLIGAATVAVIGLIVALIVIPLDQLGRVPGAVNGVIDRATFRFLKGR